MTDLIEDLTDDHLRRAMILKWGSVPPDVLPAWVAETDYALAPAVAAALADAVARGVTGYPSDVPADGAEGSPLGPAYADFARRRFGWGPDPDFVLPVSDVTAGVRLALDVLSDPGPIALPLPAYSPQLGLAATTGRTQVDVPFTADSGRAVLDLGALDHALDPAHGGARTLVLTNPHNPCSTQPTRAELEGIRDVVRRHGARVVSDEIHAPLVLPGAVHTPYLSLEGTADHAVAVVAASKAFNTPGLRCAQVVSGDAATARRLAGVPQAQNDSWSPLGVIAALAAYTDDDQWLDALIARLDRLRTVLVEELAARLPEARMRPWEATYLVWLDLRAYGHDDPAAVALERGRVQVSPGHKYHPGLPGHVRLNAATSEARLREIVRRLATAVT